MTLLLNEIHYLRGFENSIIVCAADRNITVDKKFYKDKAKLFSKEVSGYKAEISYFGLASGPISNGSTKVAFMDEFVQQALSQITSASDLGDLATQFRTQISSHFEKDFLAQHLSGFHITGFNSEGLPEFWRFTNGIWSKNNSFYRRSKNNLYNEVYESPKEDFLGRDARKRGYRPGEPTAMRGGMTVYKNGDPVTHRVVWNNINNIFREVGSELGYKTPSPSDEADYENYIKLKFKMINVLLKGMVDSDSIGETVDVHFLKKPNGSSKSTLPPIQELREGRGETVTEGASSITSV